MSLQGPSGGPPCSQLMRQLVAERCLACTGTLASGDPLEGRWCYVCREGCGPRTLTSTQVCTGWISHFYHDFGHGSLYVCVCAHTCAHALFLHSARTINSKQSRLDEGKNILLGYILETISNLPQTCQYFNLPKSKDCNRPLLRDIIWCVYTNPTYITNSTM